LDLNSRYPNEVPITASVDAKKISTALYSRNNATKIKVLSTARNVNSNINMSFLPLDSGNSLQPPPRYAVLPLYNTTQKYHTVYNKKGLQREKE